MDLKTLWLEGFNLFWRSLPNYIVWTSIEILVLQRFYCCLLRTLAPRYMPWTSKEILPLQKLYCCFEVFFLLEILLRTLNMVVLEESLLGLRLSKKFLADLKMSSGLLKCFVLVWFCMFCLPNILQKVLELFLHSGSGTNFCTFWLFTLSLLQLLLQIYNHWFKFWFEIFLQSS